MKKIISTFLLFGLGVFATNISAQSLSEEKIKILQADNVDALKKSFSKEDYTKCFKMKEGSMNLVTFAAKNNKVNTLNHLLANGADANETCNNVTPLMYSAKHGNVDAAKILMKYGANKDIKDQDGKIAKDYAVENNHEGISVIF